MLGFIQISLISLVILSVLYLASFYLIIKADNPEKLSAYESGFEPLGDARMKISI
jgi:NADH:ubiquinone oxidoreductase subunit 3 (subunit A)